MPRRKQDFSEWLCRQQGVLPKSSLRYVLEGLTPYTKANIKLTFSPNSFFNELEKFENGRYKRATLKQAYYKARRRHLIVADENGNPILSDKARQQLKEFKPKKLKGASVMVIFDIPEGESTKRSWFRRLLRELKFEQVQKSVWMSQYDCFEIISAGIIEHRLESYVRIFEARPIEA